MPVHQDPAHRHPHGGQSFPLQASMYKKRAMYIRTPLAPSFLFVLVDINLLLSLLHLVYNLQWASGDARLLGCHPSKALFFTRGCFITRGYRSRYRQAADGRAAEVKAGKSVLNGCPDSRCLHAVYFYTRGNKNPFLTDVFFKFQDFPRLHCWMKWLDHSSHF